jgi:protein TonB
MEFQISMHLNRNLEPKKLEIMKQKKVKRVDLEKKRFLFFQIGLLISLALVLIAFEWPGYEKNNQTLLYSYDEVFDEEMTEITFLEKKMPPEVRPPVAYTIEIVDNDEIIEDPIIIEDVETDIWEGINYILDDEDTEALPFFIVEERPGFNNGGVEEFRRYVAENIIYSEEALGLELFGKVFVEFTVDKTGKVTNVKIIRGIDPMLDNEVLRVIQSSPLWTPGKQRGKPVKVSYTMPVNFALQ